MKVMNQEKGVPLAEQVYLLLEDEILQGQLKKGDVITEPKLSQRLGVSRTPIREALQRLEQEDLVEIHHNRGAVIVGITKEDLEDIYDMRIRLEGLAAREAAKSVTQEQLSQLKEIIDLQEFYASRNDSHQQEVYDSRFHEKLYEISNKRVLSGVLKNLHHRILRYRQKSISNTERAKIAVKEHREILHALEIRNEERAELLMVNHIENAKVSAVKRTEAEL